MKELHHSILGGVVAFILHYRLLSVITPETTDKIVTAAISILVGLISSLLSKIVAVLITAIQNKLNPKTIQEQAKDNPNTNKT